MKRTPLARKTALKRGKSRPRKVTKRNWEAARAKVEREAVCRICGTPYALQAAHTIAREHDNRVFDIASGEASFVVDEDSIVPLCPTHHEAYDHHELDLLGKLTLEEELDAVKRAGGLELARVRLCPSEYRKTAA